MAYSFRAPEKGDVSSEVLPDVRGAVEDLEDDEPAARRTSA